jgi:hypothetical protein
MSSASKTSPVEKQYGAAAPIRAGEDGSGMKESNGG